MALPQLFGDAPDQWGEIAGIAEFRVRLPLLLQDGHSHLGEVIQREVVDRPAIHQTHGCLEPVAPEALTVSDANHKEELAADARRCTQIKTCLICVNLRASAADFIMFPAPAAFPAGGAALLPVPWLVFAAFPVDRLPRRNGHGRRRSAHPAS